MIDGGANDGPEILGAESFGASKDGMPMEGSLGSNPRSAPLVDSGFVGRSPFGSVKAGRSPEGATEEKTSTNDFGRFFMPASNAAFFSATSASKRDCAAASSFALSALAFSFASARARRSAFACAFALIFAAISASSSSAPF